MGRALDSSNNWNGCGFISFNIEKGGKKRKKKANTKHSFFTLGVKQIEQSNPGGLRVTGSLAASVN